MTSTDTKSSPLTRREGRANGLLAEMLILLAGYFALKAHVTGEGVMSQDVAAGYNTHNDRSERGNV